VAVEALVDLIAALGAFAVGGLFVVGALGRRRMR
jgi:hypothetical protein